MVADISHEKTDFEIGTPDSALKRSADLPYWKFGIPHVAVDALLCWSDVHGMQKFLSGI